MANFDCNKDWADSSVLDNCQSFLEQLPDEIRNKLISKWTNATPSPPAPAPTPAPTPTPDPALDPSLDSAPNPATSSQASAITINPHTQPQPQSSTKENEERLPRGRSKGSPSGRLKTRAAQSGSRKRRQVGHADQEEPMVTNDHSQNQSTQKQYETVPVFLQNSFPSDIKNDPKKLEQVLKSLKPEAKIKSLFLCRSGDIKLIPLTPHDENILRKDWDIHEIYGRCKPRLPKEKTASHEVTILNLPTCITNQEIKDQLKEYMMSPKDIFRFNKKGTQEPSRNVKVSFGSKMEKDKLIANGFNIYSQHFRAEETKPLPSVLQCYKCQKFGHNFYECKESDSKCLRCGGNHRLSACSIPKENARCANCSGSHAANFKGCSVFKEAQRNAQQAETIKKATQSLRNPASYAAVAHQSIPLKPQAILACLAECLSELESLFNDSVTKSQPLDDLVPFKIVASAATRHLNIHLEANDLLTKVLSPTPNSSPAKLASPPQNSSPEQPCPT